MIESPKHKYLLRPLTLRNRPPQIKDIQVLGEVKDSMSLLPFLPYQISNQPTHHGKVSGRHYPRDIGRPVYLGRETYYLFGDTFCHSSSRQFVGVSNNTIAHVPDPINDPLTCTYIHHGAYQPSFIPHTPSEEEYENDPENKKNTSRIVNWVFGGIVEDFPGAEKGWVFYEKMFTVSGFLTLNNNHEVLD